MKAYTHLATSFHERLSRYIKANSAQRPVELYTPEDYILSLGGKRIRPLLALIACELFGTDHKRALDAALSIEIFHNFSLIHDDILDEAPLRRGMPAVHKKWSTSIAILSGDMMLVKAYSVLENYAGGEFKALAHLLSATALKVCEGQQLDMNFEKREQVSSEDYIDMITKKTAVLLGCSLQMGAVNAGAEEDQQASLYRFGVGLGIAFQLMDDVLDLYSENNESGKQNGGDVLASKKTILLLKACEKCDDKKSLIELYNSPPDKPRKVEQVKKIFDSYNVKELCLAEAEKYTLSALTSLASVKADETKKETLKNFALQLLGRNN